MQKSKQKVYSNAGNQDVVNLIPAGNKYILDIGCGDGSTARLLSNQNCIIDGITISENEKASAEQVMRKVYIHNLETGLPFQEPEIYDVVICSHVLEHICYPQQLLNDIFRVLRSGGILIVALPNLMHYKSRAELFKGNFNYTPSGIWDYTHFRWYTFDTAAKLLEQHNFVNDVKTVTGSLPFNRLFQVILPSKISKLLYRILISISPGFFGYQLLFSARKP